ncbi:MAG: glutamate mutase L, partial [Dehalococcoidia bacterium]|nr:glutamate mutase L [Dehalococcoidia bacterium]
DMRIWHSPSIGQNELEALIKHVSSNVATVPQEERDFLVDIALARSAVRIAVERHAGSIEPSYTPSGTVYIQRGKDLTQTKTVVGTGGVIAYGREPKWVLEAASFDERVPNSLRPRLPQFLVDKDYILYAVGLLSEISPEKALRIAKKSLVPV